MPLEHPDRDEIELTAVLHALSDPQRLRIVAVLAADEEPRACGSFGLEITKSTCTHHFRVLREAGLLEQHQEGLTRSSRVRIEDVEQRFPGLLDLVFAWEVPAALMRTDLVEGAA